MIPGNVISIARVELRRLLRSRMTFTLLLLVPVLQVILFGFAIRPEGARVRIAVAAPSEASAAPVMTALRKDAQFRLTGPVLPQGQAQAAVRKGEADIGLELPEVASFANPFAPRLPVKIVADAANPALTSVAVARLEARYWQERSERADAAGTGVQVVRLFNPDARADWAFLPALAGVTVMIAMVMLGSLAVSREREGGTWETLRSLPVSAGEVLVGKVLPGTVLGTVQGALVLAIGVLAFHLPIRGNVLALLALLPLFAAAHLVIGYAISVRAATQLAALQGAVAFYLPAMLLSGFLYPFETLPGWARLLGNLFPLSHFIRAAQGATLRGASGSVVLYEGIAMAAVLGAAVALALIGQKR